MCAARELIFAVSILSLLHVVTSQNPCGPATVTCTGQCCTTYSSWTTSGITGTIQLTSYGGGWTCEWTIAAKNIQISIRNLNVNTELSYDFVRFISSLSTTINTASGNSNNVASAWFSSYQTMKVRFTSDTSNQVVGFKSEWKITDVPCTGPVSCLVGHTDCDNTGPLLTCCGCSIGTYKTTISTESCRTCSAGSISPAYSIASTDCVCNAGYTGPNGGPCSACTLGNYKTSKGTPACINCAAGTYADIAGSTTCKNCVAGTYLTTTGATALATCTNCINNTYSTSTSATTVSTCTACPVGTSSQAGSSSLANCVLPDCAAGSTGPTGGPCTACAAGKYKTATGSAACTDCGAGTYSAATGATAAGTCQSCPTNSQSTPGSDAATDCVCVAGFSGPDGGACTTCAAGKYKPAAGSAGCTDCLANSYHALTGRTAASACQCNAGTRVGVACARALACPACPACPACLVCLVLRHCRSAYFKGAGHALPRRHRRQIHAVLHGVFVSRTDCIILNRIMYSWTTG
jgi:hypothetical protein